MEEWRLFCIKAPLNSHARLGEKHRFLSDNEGDMTYNARTLDDFGLESK